MHETNYDYYQCATCVEFDAALQGRRHCKKHDFVMPEFADYVVCADWHLANPGVSIPFEGGLEKNILYWWNDVYYPHPIDQFAHLQELRIHRVIQIAKHPNYGWLIIIPRQDGHLYQTPGGSITLQLDNESAVFSLADEEIDTYFTSGTDRKKQRVGMRTEAHRIAAPQKSDLPLFVEWIDLHFGIEGAGQKTQKDALSNIPEALRLYGRIVGSPDHGNMKLMAGFIRESANSDEESEEPGADG